jgi:deoxyribonuclease-1
LVIGAKKAEPPENVQGDIARTYFYMAGCYKLKLSTSQKRLLEVWNNSDAVDAWERKRNQKIKSIQGNVNPFIQ